MTSSLQTIGHSPNSGQSRGVEAAAAINDPDVLRWVVATHSRATRRAAARNLQRIARKRKTP